MYSQIKNIKRDLPPNSIKCPATNSDSASVWSKGARLASNSNSTKKKNPNIGELNIRDKFVCIWDSIVKLPDLSALNKNRQESINSNKIFIIIKRCDAMVAYLDFEDRTTESVSKVDIFE